MNPVTQIIQPDIKKYASESHALLLRILTLTDPERIRPKGSSHKRYEARQGRVSSAAPEQRVFIIGKPIELDCREMLRDFLEGRSRKSTALTTQFLVRGYWRQQPYGPKNSLRRRQWIQPFWRGPEEGVIPVREHKLGDGPSES